MAINFIKSITYFFFLVILYIFVSPQIVLSDTSPNTKWSHTISKDSDNTGTEKSVRQYLLVYLPGGEEQERRITVSSNCEKGYPAEGTYGQCKHKVKVQPINANFTLTTGEDVVLVSLCGAPLLLATLEYGCCASPDKATLYDERGNNLGSIEYREDYRELGWTFSNKNVITRTFYMGSATCLREKGLRGKGYLMVDKQLSTATKVKKVAEQEKSYGLVEKRYTSTSFEALIFENEKVSKRIPVLLTIPDQKKCDDWWVEEFSAFSDVQDAILKLGTTSCIAGEQTFRCSITDSVINCMPQKAKDSK